MYNPGVQYVPPPVRSMASTSGAPTWLETMTYTVFEVAGIPLRVHASFAVFLAVKTFVGLAYFGFSFAWMTFLLDGPILFMSVLIAELSHCAVAHYYGAQITNVSLWPLGGLSYVGHRSVASEEFGIALAGPASHLVQGIFWLFLGAEMVPVSALTASSATTSVGSPPAAVGSSDYATVYTNFWLELCSFALLLQFLLFWLNVTIPVYPLDGGRLTVATLSYLGVGLESAAYITAALGLASGGLILLYGLLGSATTTALGIWVVYEAYNLRRKAASGEADFHPLFANYAGGPPGQLPSTYAAPGQFPTPPPQGMGYGGGPGMGGPPPYVADGGANKGMNAPSGTYGAL